MAKNMIKDAKEALFRIVTINVRGLRNYKKRHILFNWLKEKNIDIAFLQETYCTADNVTNFDKEWDGISVNCLSESCHSKGVSILFKKLILRKSYIVHAPKMQLQF